MPYPPGTEPVKINYVVGLTPTWVMEQSGDLVSCAPGSTNCPGITSCCCPAYNTAGLYCNQVPTDLQEFTNFVTALVMRYSSTIDAYEVWNEPQTVNYVYPQDTRTVTIVANMVNIVGTLVHQFSTLHPAPYVVGPSCLPRNSSGGMQKCGMMLDALDKQGSFAVKYLL